MKSKIEVITAIAKLPVFVGFLLLALSLGAGVLPYTAYAQSPNSDLAFDTEDLDFILKQIEFAERHAAGEDLTDILPNASVPWGVIVKSGV
jgi:hypothetical protein